MQSSRRPNWWEQPHRAGLVHALIWLMPGLMVALLVLFSLGLRLAALWVSGATMVVAMAIGMLTGGFIARR